MSLTLEQEAYLKMIADIGVVEQADIVERNLKITADVEQKEVEKIEEVNVVVEEPKEK